MCLNITLCQGDVRVEYKMDKADLSTKKLRRKARKKVRSQLYSNFVSAGTLTGGKMEGGETADTVEEVRYSFFVIALKIVCFF